jgi:hypothetical protein
MFDFGTNFAVDTIGIEKDKFDLDVGVNGRGSIQSTKFETGIRIAGFSHFEFVSDFGF